VEGGRARVSGETEWAFHRRKRRGKGRRQKGVSWVKKQVQFGEAFRWTDEIGKIASPCRSRGEETREEGVV
jgi:hypothetical protein